MKIKNGVFEEMNMLQGIADLRKSRKLKAVTKFRVHKFFKQFDTHAQDYFDIKKEIMEKHSDGINDDNTYKWKSPAAEKKVMIAIQELWDAETDIKGLDPLEINLKTFPDDILDSLEMGKLEDLGIIKFKD